MELFQNQSLGSKRPLYWSSLRNSFQGSESSKFSMQSCTMHYWFHLLDKLIIHVKSYECMWCVHYLVVSCMLNICLAVLWAELKAISLILTDDMAVLKSKWFAWSQWTAPLWGSCQGNKGWKPDQCSNTCDQFNHLIHMVNWCIVQYNNGVGVLAIERH